MFANLALSRRCLAGSKQIKCSWEEEADVPHNMANNNNKHISIYIAITKLLTILIILIMIHTNNNSNTTNNNQHTTNNRATRTPSGICVDSVGRLVVVIVYRSTLPSHDISRMSYHAHWRAANFSRRNEGVATRQT